MKKSNTFILSAFIVLLFSNIFPLSAKEKIKTEDLCKDISRIQYDLQVSEIRQHYDPQPFEELKKKVMKKKIDRIDCIFEIQKIISSYKIMHCGVGFSDTDQSIRNLIAPFIFKNFGEDLYVFFTLKEYEKYLGWKLVEMGGYSSKEITEILASYFPYETPVGARYAADSDLPYRKLQHAGLVQKNGKMKFVFQDMEGNLETVVCKSADRASKDWTVFVPKKQNPYLTLSENFFNPKNYFIQEATERKTLYIHYNSCFAMSDYLLTNFHSDLKTSLNNNQFETVVIDLRYNSGGFRNLIEPIFYDVKDELLKRNLAVVISGRTYSAATEFLNFILNAFPNATLFGEETGQAVLNYTSVFSKRYSVLNCDISFPSLISDVPALYERAEDIYRGTMPDVQVYETFEDFSNGEDSVYKVIEEYYEYSDQQKLF